MNAVSSKTRSTVHMVTCHSYSSDEMLIPKMTREEGHLSPLPFKREWRQPYARWAKTTPTRVSATVLYRV